jgi:hypothetical protein
MHARPHQRLAARILTGPLGHLAAALADWTVLLTHYASARARGRDPWA